MAIATTTNKALYVGNGATTAFTAPFLFYDNSQIQVSLVDTTTGVQTMQAQGTDYSVTGAGAGSGGTVTFVTAPPVGKNVLVKRVVPATQLVDLKEGDKFPPEVIEQSLDLGAMIDQQLAEVDTRCIKLPESSTISNIELPDITLPGNRSKAITINSTGDGFDLVAVSPTDFANPLTTKGDMVVHNGTAASRIAAGTDGSFLIANAASGQGIKYLVPGSDGQVLRANSQNANKVAYEDVSSSETFRGLVFRSHPDSDVSSSKCLLEKATEVIFNDGTRVQGLSNLVLDKTVTGAGGLQAAAVASTWYRAYVIRKRSDGTVNLFGQRAKDFFLDQSQTLNDTSYALRKAGAPVQTKLAQSFQTATTGALQFLDVPLTKSNAPTGNIWFTVEADQSGTPSGTPLATSMKLDVSRISTAGAFYRFVFRTPATLTASTTYWVVFQGDYTASDTINVTWAAKGTTNPYASGTAAKFDAGAWGNVANTDFNFKLYVTRNDTAISLPTGYDQYAQIGWFWLDGSTNIRGFKALNRRVDILPQVNSGATVPSTNPLLLDLSAVIPPAPVAFMTVGQSSAGANVVLSGSPDGYGIVATATDFGGVLISVPAAGLGSIVPVVTDWQSVYAIVSAGSGTIWYNAYEW